MFNQESDTVCIVYAINFTLKMYFNIMFYYPFLEIVALCGILFDQYIKTSGSETERRLNCFPIKGLAGLGVGTQL